jgi:hypothetical protein
MARLVQRFWAALAGRAVLMSTHSILSFRVEVTPAQGEATGSGLGRRVTFICETQYLYEFHK